MSDQKNTLNEKFKAIICDQVRAGIKLPEHWTHDQFTELENEIYHTVLLCVKEEIKHAINCKPNETGDRVLNRLTEITNQIENHYA